MADLPQAAPPARVGRPIRRGENVAEAVARDIVRRIWSERLARGTQLPSEAEMLADYGVGGASLCEALRILEIHGLISIRPGTGGGPVVAGVHTEDFGRMSALYHHLIGSTFRELIEARLILHPVLARLAAERRAPRAGVERPSDDSGAGAANRRPLSRSADSSASGLPVLERQLQGLLRLPQAALRRRPKGGCSSTIAAENSGPSLQRTTGDRRT